MASLTYSAKALDTLHKFHRKELIVFVEGPDDVPFWDCVFASLGLASYLIKQAGGSNEIDKYTTSICVDNAKIVVARDADYVDFTIGRRRHSRVLYTLGHSIENSLYSAQNVALLIAKGARRQPQSEPALDRWRNQVEQICGPLLKLEIAVAQAGRGAHPLSANFGKYCDPPNSHHACPNRVTTTYQAMSAAISVDHISSADTALQADTRGFWFIARGHFLTSAVRRFVRWAIKQERTGAEIPTQEAMFQILVSQFGAATADPEDWKHLKRQVTGLKRISARGRPR